MAFKDAPKEVILVFTDSEAEREKDDSKVYYIETSFVFEVRKGVE